MGAAGEACTLSNNLVTLLPYRSLALLLLMMMMMMMMMMLRD
jgi:hypothetical protein